MLNAEVALLLCEKDDKQKTIPLRVTFTQWLIETPKPVSNILNVTVFYTAAEIQNHCTVYFQQ